ncbi:hypothetical protein AQUCO_00200352v1 [Aquilegia coerulea]|uniref:SGNH hydrolase-type esterase domain-containing protein n=1 Tax=Aquilegia coerulea TaxID=218851 RepID=A0A2G5F2S3_AQUCA|nr:hypothetical protein AQUCO_00200352v1 [Aquilegia coerulea]
MASKTFSLCFTLLMICSPLFLLPSDAARIHLGLHGRRNNHHHRHHVSSPPTTTTNTPPSPPPMSGDRATNHCSYDAIYNFGDSISDTGNLIREGPAGAFSPFAHLPYGETYFNKATGRCSNGLLMIDFLAEKVGLPMLNPYLDKSASFNQGVNFAVAGSTAMETERLMDKRILSPVTNSSLLVQFDWFKDHLRYICSTDAECANKLRKAIFMVGETGGNDINYALLQGKTIAEAQSLVHDIVNNIIKVALRLIDLGATKLVVPGNFPIGCFPIYLDAFENSLTFDENSCLKELNELAMYQNQYLQRALQQLREEKPDVVILYADYYKAFQHVFNNASQLGFDEITKETACCGAGGNYHFTLARMCGTDEAGVCSNPNQFISWDGIHPTQAAYQRMAEWLIKDLSVFHCTA